MLMKTRGIMVPSRVSYKPKKGGCALIAEKGQRRKDYCMAVCSWAR